MKYGVIANPDRHAVRGILSHLIEWCGEQHCSVILNNVFKGDLSEFNSKPVEFVNYEDEIAEQADFIVAIGGDGTILWASQLVKDRDIPILGVNCGRMGFLADIREDQLLTALDATKHGSYYLDRRHMLVSTLPDGTEHYALNELLFARAGKASMITLTAEYDGLLVNKYWADGLIVSTPTGSTAYNLSSGGPIVMPQTNVVILTPINPHTLTTRPLVLPGDRELQVIVDPPEQEILFSNDGRECPVDPAVKQFTIKRTDFSVNLVKLQTYNYFQTLRTKLMWGLDFRK